MLKIFQVESNTDSVLDTIIHVIWYNQRFEVVFTFKVIFIFEDVFTSDVEMISFHKCMHYHIIAI